MIDIQRIGYCKSAETITMDKWIKVKDTGNFMYLSKWPTFRNDESDKSILVFDAIFNEWLALGGMGSDFKDLLKLKQSWHYMRSEWLLTGNLTSKMDSVRLAIDIKDAKKTMSESASMSEEEVLFILSKNIGSVLRTKDVTLHEFQSYINFNKKSA